MGNPFDDEHGVFHVLINAEEQYSLWPVFAEVPEGWTIVLESKSRSECLAYVNQNWLDIRPKSLKDAILKYSKE